MKNVIIAQSGGPTSAINATLAGVISGVRKSGRFGKIYGSLHGVTGVLEENFIDLTDAFKADSDDPSNTGDFTQLISTPAMYLGSCRYKLTDPMEDPSDYNRLFEIFKKLDIGAFFYIGGNDSMDTAAKLAEYGRILGSYISFIGVPKTIDNDLVLTDHTPGYGSAAKYIATSMLEIAHDTYIYGIPCVTIVEIMGRDAGWLTAAAALARNEYNETPQLIYLPEVPFSIDSFLNDVREKLKIHNNLVIAVSEGIRDENGIYITSTAAAADKFGHAQLSGAGKALEIIVKKEIGVKCRSIELNILQRCAAHVASSTDLKESFELGEAGAALAAEGKTGLMPAIIRDSDEPYTYHIDAVDTTQVANKESNVPVPWITPDGNDVTDELITYIKPLIQGESFPTFRGGLPCYMNISHLSK